MTTLHRHHHEKHDMQRTQKTLSSRDTHCALPEIHISYRGTHISDPFWSIRFLLLAFCMRLSRQLLQAELQHGGTSPPFAKQPRHGGVRARSHGNKCTILQQAELGNANKRFSDLSPSSLRSKLLGQEAEPAGHCDGLHTPGIHRNPTSA